MSNDLKRWYHPTVPAEEQRTIRVRPGWHRCDPNPVKNYGIGGAEMVWILQVGDWAITWELLTDWGMPTEAFNAACPDCDHPRHQDGYPRARPMGGAVQWHAPVPMFDGTELVLDECPITGAPCYRDIGYLIGDDLYARLTTEGDEAVWRQMRVLLDDRMNPGWDENDENEEGQET